MPCPCPCMQVDKGLNLSSEHASNGNGSHDMHAKKKKKRVFTSHETHDVHDGVTMMRRNAPGQVIDNTPNVHVLGKCFVGEE